MRECRTPNEEWQTQNTMHLIDDWEIAAIIGENNNGCITSLPILRANSFAVEIHK
jgi:hypothetical protein